MNSDNNDGTLNGSMEDRTEDGVWTVDGVILGMSARFCLKQ